MSGTDHALRTATIHSSARAGVPGSAAGLPWRAGIGLKPKHFGEVLATRPDIGFFEVHAENYMVDGGPFHHFLMRVREHYALSLHGVGLSIGGVDPLDERHLDRLAALIKRYEPASFSEHLAWSSHGEFFYNDLLPLPYERRTLDHVCAHIDRVQERLGLRMLLENPSTYLEFEASTMSETAFLREVLERTGCGLLLDVNNVHVSCTNHGRDARAYLRDLPLAKVGEIHLAGFARDHDAAGAPLLIDSHGSPVDEAVWGLYTEVIAQIGAVPTLLERDNDVPALQTLLAEAGRAESMMNAGTELRHFGLHGGSA
jgi:uncharacterized protein (UPF0276 family)